ncbi:MAG: hypothetical protein RR494_09100 [Vagococcus sp.]|uniref:hypothetical protein n=1 Tax=Vagococcus sp. TaxID=1933889 RepID=UPI002FC7F1FF
MRKSLLVVISTLVTLSFLLLSFTVNQAEEGNKKESPVGIQFEKERKKDSGEGKPPLINGGSNKPPVRLLPETGELLTSLIFILLGISIVIFSLGVLTIKQLYQKTSWEV